MAKAKRFITVRSNDCKQPVYLEVLSETRLKIVTKQLLAVHIVGGLTSHRMKGEVHWNKTTGRITPNNNGLNNYRIIDGI